MPILYNPEVHNEIRTAAKTQPGSQTINTSLHNVAIPTIEVNPKIVKNGYSFPKSQSTTGTVYLGNPGGSTRDFYITGVYVSFVKDASCDVATGDLQVDIPVLGTNIAVVVMPVITLTAEKFSTFVSFGHPIKVDKGGNFQFTGTFTA